MVAVENQRDKVIYVIPKINSTPAVIKLVLTAGLFSLRKDGIKAIEKIIDPVAKTMSCH